MEKLKKSRLEIRISYVVTIAISIAVSIWASGLIMTTFDQDTIAYYSAGEWVGFRILFIVLCLCLMFGALILPVSWAFRKKYSREFRGYFFKTAMDKYFDKVEWNPKKGFDKEFIASLGIIDAGYRFRSDNFFECTDQGNYFEMADVRVMTYWVQESANAAKKKSLTNPATAANRQGYAFHGQWMALDTNKNVNSNIVIVPNYMGDTNLSSTFGGNRIETGMPEFDMKFKVYDDSPWEANGILTREVLAQLLIFARKANCQYYFGFEGNKLYIGIHSFGQGKYLKVGSSFKNTNFEEVQAEADEDIREVKALLEFLNK